jgi:hypothetical protein
MKHKTKVLKQGKWWTLSKRISTLTNRTSYIIQVDGYKISGDFTSWNIFPTRPTAFSMQLDELRELFGPGRNIGGKHNTKWKFGNLKQAEELLRIAILKFGV